MGLRDIALAVIVLGLLPICLIRPWIGILVWTWIGMMNPQWLVYGFAHEIPWAMLVGGTTLVGLVFIRDRKPVPWNAQLVLVVLLLSYFAVTTLFAWSPEAAREKLELVSKVVLMAIAGTTVIYGRRRIRWLLVVIALSIGFYGIKGGSWALMTGGANRVWGPEGGFMQGNNALGLALLMVVPVMLALAREYDRTWVRTLFRVGALLSCVSVIFTYSRGAMLGLAASAPFMLLSSKKKILALAFIVPVVAVGIVLAPEKIFQRAETISTYEYDGSAMQRLAAWSAAWNIAVDHPLAGGGLDMYETTDPDKWLAYVSPDFREYLDAPAAAHSIYLQILGEHGFLAFALYLALLFSTLRRCTLLRKCTSGNPDIEWIGNYANAIRIGLIGYMISGAFLSSALFDLAWVYFTFTAILDRELRNRRAEEAAPERRRPDIPMFGRARTGHPPRVRGAAGDAM